MEPTRIPPSRRPLRLGARGEGVRHLQLQLKRLGYDPGPVDGLFGWLTFAALQDLQKHLRLTVDGVAGRQVQNALNDDALVHLRYPLVIGEPDPSVGSVMADRLIQRYSPALSGIALAWRVDDEMKQEKPPPTSFLSSADPAAAARKHGLTVWHTLHTRTEHGIGYARDELQRYLHRKDDRQKLRQRALQLLTVREVDGLFADLGDIRWGDGRALLSVVRQVHNEAQRRHRQFIVAMPLSAGGSGWRRLFTAVERALFAARSMGLVLVPPLLAGRDEANPPSVAQLSAAIEEVVKEVPPWRCLLMIPLRATVVYVDGGQPPLSVSYQQALAFAYRQRQRPRWDETIGRSFYEGTKESESVRVWLENRDSIERKLSLVRRWRLAGMYLTGVGAEDSRVWTIIRERWQVYRANH